EGTPANKWGRIVYSPTRYLPDMWTKLTRRPPYFAIAADRTPSFSATPNGNAIVYSHVLKGANVHFLDGSTMGGPYKAYEANYKKGVSPSFAAIGTDYDNWHGQ